jgi:NTP pyrophosphatase (non-canonical NTP hydrolase)
MDHDIESPPGLTPAYRERLEMLAEECAEAIKAVTKILRHGADSAHPVTGKGNAQALREEIGDVLAIVTLMQSRGDLPGIPDAVEVLARKAPYMHHQLAIWPLPERVEF